MHQHDTNQQWAEDGTSAWGSASDSPQANSGSEVLAKIPDLTRGADLSDDAPRPRSRKKSKSEGVRILGRRISTRLLVGGGVLLVLAAIVPFLFNGGNDPEGGQPLAPDADLAPAFDTAQLPASNPQQVTPNPWYEPSMSFDPTIPAGPDFAGPDFASPNSAGLAGAPGESARPPGITINAPRAIGDRQAVAPDWSRGVMQPLTAPRTQAPPSATGMPAASGQPGRYEGRFEAARPDPAYYRPYGQPRANPNGPQANTLRPQASTNRPMAIPNGSPRASGEYRGNYQADPRAEARANYGTYYQADARANPSRNYRSGPQQPRQPAAQPGVARFEGTIR